jgi:lysine 6-dehydrogenase
MKYLIIGSGRMAMGIVFDLLNYTKTKEIHVTDREPNALQQMQKRYNDERLFTHQINSDNRGDMLYLMQKVDGVLSAVPYDYNYQLTQWAIENRCHFVDLGGNFHVVKQQFTLDQTAKRAGVGVIPDCGLAPGMASVVAAHAIEKLDTVDTLEIRVGGLPLNPRTPLNYMLIFSVHGLTNECIEPSVILENSDITIVPPMTGVESLDFPEPFGKLEAFYSSGGTSTLPKTYQGDIKNLNYKTIRYPGHCELFKAMIDLGFAAEEPLQINNKKFTRREIFERLLEETLTLEGEDVTLIRIIVKGISNGKHRKWTYQAIEYGDKKNDLTAMMRTTAFPAILTLEMLVDGRIKDRGVLCQELSIPPDIFLQELEKRNIRFEITEGKF